MNELQNSAEQQKVNVDPVVMPFDKVLKNVCNGILSRSDAELAGMGTDGLERYWHFAWDSSLSVEWNVYQFHKMLDLYGSFCRRWEEMHNGHCCVVERVRDKYLMPKIKEFIATVKGVVA